MLKVEYGGNLMRKIGIIGLGHVGADVAYTLCREKLVSHLVLIDKLEEKVLAEKLEIEDSLVPWDYSVKIDTQNYGTLRDAEIVIISVGSQSIDNENRNSELLDNVASVKETIPRVVASGFKGIFIVISNPCDTITRLVQEVSGFPQSRVIGTGTLLDTSRMKRIVSQHFNVSPQDVTGYVLGEHGESQFIPWSLVQIDGKSLLENYSLSMEEAELLKEKTRLGGWEIHSGKGWTSFGIASMCARLVQAIQLDENRIYPVSVYDEREKLYLGYPAKIGRKGISQKVDVVLTEKESDLYRSSAQAVREVDNLIK
jgi:malate/lactate dehydrogenase